MQKYWKNIVKGNEWRKGEETNWKNYRRLKKGKRNTEGANFAKNTESTSTENTVNTSTGIVITAVTAKEVILGLFFFALNYGTLDQFFIFLIYKVCFESPFETTKNLYLFDNNLRSIILVNDSRIYVNTSKYGINYKLIEKILLQYAFDIF